MEEKATLDDINIKHVSKLKRNTDLDEFSDTFDKWQNFTTNLLKQNIELKEKVDNLMSERIKCDHKIQEQNKEVVQLRGSLSLLHSHLNAICDLENENRNLKKEIQEKEAKLQNLQIIFDEEQLCNERKIHELVKKNKGNLDMLENEYRQRMETERDSLTNVINMKNNDLDKLGIQLKEKDKEHETQIVKMSLDYENKLTKLKQRIPVAGKQQNSSNQEIYRMKLQNLKVEYESEINNLKETVRNLEERLGHLGNRGFSTCGRQKRKF